MGKKNKGSASEASAVAARLPHSTPEHLKSIEHAIAIAMAMPKGSVSAPAVPVADLLRDARSVASPLPTPSRK